MTTIIFACLFLILLPFAPVYVEFAGDFTGWELKLTRMFLYRAMISVWRSRTHSIDFYVNFTRFRDWQAPNE